MADKPWKAFERRICKLFGGVRRGADYGDGTEGGGKNDCKGTPGWSVEIKFLKRPSWGVMLANAHNAVERKKEPTDIGIGIVKKNAKGLTDNDNTLVMMTLGEFKRHFPNIPCDE